MSTSSVALGDAIVYFGGVSLHVGNAGKSSAKSSHSMASNALTVLNCRTWCWSTPPVRGSLPPRRLHATLAIDRASEDTILVFGGLARSRYSGRYRSDDYCGDLHELKVVV